MLDIKRRLGVGLAIWGLAWVGGAAAHDGHSHAPKAGPGTEAPAAVTTPVPATPFPVSVDARFDLIDHTGAARTERDYRGSYPWIFFGYANCLGICSVALPRMAEAINLLNDETAQRIRPILITVDPEADTPAAMAEKLAELHPALIGLTGSDEALAQARRRFGVKLKLLFTDPAGNPTYAHGGFLYLLGPEGELLTVMPPILSADRMAELVEGYLAGRDGG